MTSTNQSIFNIIKKLKLKIIIPAMVLLIILPLLLVGKANEMGYCVPEFRKLSDDELYERGMRNYMNSLVCLGYGPRDNLPILKKDPDRTIYPDIWGSHGFYFPLWILDGKITIKDYMAKSFEYSKTDDAKDSDIFYQAIRFLNARARTVLNGLSPELRFAQRNNSFAFVYYYDSSYLSFMAYNCCYISDVNALKNYADTPKKYQNLYEYYQNEPTLRKPFWKKYTGWREVFLILDEKITNSTFKQTIFMPISNCGLIDPEYALYD